MMCVLCRAAERRWRRADDHGRINEDLARRHLLRSGCNFVARDGRTRCASGDLAGWHGLSLGLPAELGAPETAVDAETHDRLVPGARDSVRRADIPWRYCPRRARARPRIESLPGRALIRSN